MAETSLDQGQDGGHNTALTAVSNDMVRIYKEHFGRGPNGARAAFAGRDCLVVTLEGSMTQAERNLASMGEHQRLREVRLYFQYASELHLRQSVERVMGRRVRAFVSGLDTEQDVATEIFYLEPQ